MPGNKKLNANMPGNKKLNANMSGNKKLNANMSCNNNHLITKIHLITKNSFDYQNTL